jgi:hypothetical protein
LTFFYSYDIIYLEVNLRKKVKVMTDAQKFYIVKRPVGTCDIIPADMVSKNLENDDPNIIEKWGPYDSPQDAIARRVGLIRARKCQPQ